MVLGPLQKYLCHKYTCSGLIPYCSFVMVDGLVDWSLTSLFSTNTAISETMCICEICSPCLVILCTRRMFLVVWNIRLGCSVTYLSRTYIQNAAGSVSFSIYVRAYTHGGILQRNFHPFCILITNQVLNGFLNPNLVFDWHLSERWSGHLTRVRLSVSGGRVFYVATLNDDRYIIL